MFFFLLSSVSDDFEPHKTFQHSKIYYIGGKKCIYFLFISYIIQFFSILSIFSEKMKWNKKNGIAQH